VVGEVRAFYVERTEDKDGKPIYKVWDYYRKLPICTITIESPRTAEYYADKIAYALNNVMPVKP
jgi:hypothetical protein